jgi:hypothetical protein
MRRLQKNILRYTKDASSVGLSFKPKMETVAEILSTL